MAKNLLISSSGLNVHAIEYREAVVEIAKKYFYLSATNRLVIHIDDAMHYIKYTDIKSDIIFSDLYNSQGMKPKQIKAPFLRDCKNTINQEGILVLNIRHTSPKLQEELDELLAIEFDYRLLSFEVESGNRIALAFKNDISLITKDELLTKGKWLQEEMNVPMERYAELHSF
ncbi:MAG: spermidine synthase [Polaribacter sp.]|jgi:spermidine synthase